MNSNVVIIVLSAALLLAVGLLLYGVGRFVYGIGHYYFKERKPPREFRHWGLGVLRLDGGVWDGNVKRGGREVRFLVAGTDVAPDAGLLGRASELLGKFEELERIALEFLRNHEQELKQAQMNFYSVEFLWEDKPNDFILEFLADGDDSRVWRVEFEAGQPKRTGFDD